jgi:hypothetical protein
MGLSNIAILACAASCRWGAISQDSASSASTDAVGELLPAPLQLNNRSGLTP